MLKSEPVKVTKECLKTFRILGPINIATFKAESSKLSIRDTNFDPKIVEYAEFKIDGNLHQVMRNI